MKTFDTLYKRTSTGAVQIWFMEVEDDRYRSTSGQIDGKKTTTEWTVAKPKNEGKANGTTGAQQAVAEVEAEYKKKLKKDYHRNLDSIDVAMRFKPMLADKWESRRAKITQTNVHIQPKLDGMRCIATKDGLFSRNGEPIKSAPHIHEQLQPIFNKFPGIVIDGELYNHDFRDDFNKIMSLAKKTKPTAEDLQESAELLQYWVYDYESKDDFAMRTQHLQNLIDIMLPKEKSIIIVSTNDIHISNVDHFAAMYIEEGFEGAMVRLHGKYEGKRSKTLLKWKEFQDAEFTIFDIQEGDGNRSGMAARVVLQLPDGRTFSAGIIGNVDYCKQLLKEKDLHIGEPGTVIFQNYTPDGIPRFPKFKAVRCISDM